MAGVIKTITGSRAVFATSSQFGWNAVACGLRKANLAGFTGRDGSSYTCESMAFAMFAGQQAQQSGCRVGQHESDENKSPPAWRAVDSDRLSREVREDAAGAPWILYRGY